MARRLKGQSSTETRSAILDLIRSSGSVSRIELSEQSGLTEATISKIVRSLITDGLVVEAGYASSTGGKRPVLLELNTASRFALGISLDATAIVYVLCDLGGTKLHSMTADGTGHEPPEAVIKRIAQQVRRFLRKHAVDVGDIVGIGVAGAGRLDTTGALRSSRRAAEWEDFDVESALEEATGLPAILDNDANCAALGEFWSGRMPTTHDFATIYMATGIGCGIVVRGDLYRGASSNAGEIGHLIIDVDGPPCWCGARGCLEMLAAPAAVVARARDDEQLADRLGLAGETDVRRAFSVIGRAAAAGDEAAEALIRQSADYLAIALLGLTNVFDLDRLSLSGPGFGDAGTIYLDVIRSRLNALSFMRSVHPVEVQLSAVGEESAALGAASVVLHSHLTPHNSSSR